MSVTGERMAPRTQQQQHQVQKDEIISLRHCNDGNEVDIYSDNNMSCANRLKEARKNFSTS